MLSKGEQPVVPDTQKTRKRLQNTRFPSSVMLNCQAASVQSRLKKASSGCKDVMIMSLLRVLQAIARSSAQALTKATSSNSPRIDQIHQEKKMFTKEYICYLY